MDCHEGRIGVISSGVSGEGCVFVIEIPLLRLDAPSSTRRHALQLSPVLPESQGSVPETTTLPDTSTSLATSTTRDRQGRPRRSTAAYSQTKPRSGELGHVF